MIHFVGAGSGAPDLITVRGQKFLREADVVIYAGSLVNPELLKETKPGCEILNSAYMTLDEVIRAMEKAEREGKMTVRLHTGDPAIYGAIREQMDRLGEKKIAYAGFKSWKQNDLYPDDFTKRYHSIAYGMDQETLYLSVGLLNTSCVFDSEGNFTLTVKKAPIKGKLTANSDGTFKMVWKFTGNFKS